MVESIGGIRNSGDAFWHIIIAPQSGGKVTVARVRYDSVRGLTPPHGRPGAAGSRWT